MEKWKSGLNRIQRGALLNDLQPAALSLREDMQGVEETLLTGLQSKGPTDFDSIRVPPMELRSFNLTFT